MVSSDSPSILSGRNPIIYRASDPLSLFIVQLLLIICLCRLLHLVLYRLRQPTVISEILGGILLGPTVLGRWSAFTNSVFPQDSLVNLNLVANFGLVLFLFMVGLELDPRVLRQNLHKSLAISIAGMVLPFGLGIATSYALYHLLMNGEGQFVDFMLFCGVAMAITAFPVLARILTEQNLLKTTVGSISISAAAIDDMVSWCLLALIVALTNNSSGLTALWVFLVGTGWTLFVLFAVRPLYHWYLRRAGCLKGREPTQLVLFVTFGMVLVSAFFTDALGIHAIFGAFLVGLIVPHQGGFAIRVTEKLEDLVQIFFLPIYFALSGLKTNLSDLNDGKTWGLLVLICFVAFFGKIAGCSLAARLIKFSWRESLTIGFLMNCKGLVELIVLNIGLEAGVIDTRVFTMMVVKALVTTFVTTPVVMFLYPPQYQTRVDDVKQEESKSTDVLVVISRLGQVPGVMTLLGYLHNNKSIRVFGLRLLELSEGNSAIMNQYESDQMLIDDPALSMFRTIARVTSLPFHSLLTYSERDRYVDSILSYSQNKQLCLVSAFGKGSQQQHQQQQQQQVRPGWFKSMGFGFTQEQQSQFIKELFRRAQTPVGVFIDCGLSDDIECEESLVVVPFLGGPDDRKAVELATQLCAGNPNVRVVVWRMVRADHPTDQDVVLDEGRYSAEPSIPPQTSRPVASSQENQIVENELRVEPTRVNSKEMENDQLLLDNLVSDTAVVERPPESEREETVGIRRRISLKLLKSRSKPNHHQITEQSTRHPNISIQTIVTSTPLQTLLLKARRDLSSSDLVICGRSVQLRLPYFSCAAELEAYHPVGSSYRQRGLGVVAEYMLGFGTKASLLVVQNKTTLVGQ